MTAGRSAGSTLASTPKPSRPGIWTSSSTRSGFCSAMALTASKPSPHSPMISMSGLVLEPVAHPLARQGLVVHDQGPDFHPAPPTFFCNVAVLIRKETQGVTEYAEPIRPKNPDETFKNRKDAGAFADGRHVVEDKGRISGRDRRATAGQSGVRPAEYFFCVAAPGRLCASRPGLRRRVARVRRRADALAVAASPTATPAPDLFSDVGAADARRRSARRATSPAESSTRSCPSTIGRSSPRTRRGC